MAQAAYAPTPEHMRLIRDDLDSQGAQDLKWKRYRGLGSMPGELVRERCVSPSTRELQTLSPAHASQAQAMFAALRGE